MASNPGPTGTGGITSAIILVPKQEAVHNNNNTNAAASLAASAAEQEAAIGESADKRIMFKYNTGFLTINNNNINNLFVMPLLSLLSTIPTAAVAAAASPNNNTGTGILLSVLILYVHRCRQHGTIQVLKVPRWHQHQT